MLKEVEEDLMLKWRANTKKKKKTYVVLQPSSSLS